MQIVECSATEGSYWATGFSDSTYKFLKAAKPSRNTFLCEFLKMKLKASSKSYVVTKCL